MYIAKAGETFDIIALYLYGRSSYARYLIEANPQYVEMVYFMGGEVLTVPELPEEETAPTAPWKGQ